MAYYEIAVKARILLGGLNVSAINLWWTFKVNTLQVLNG